MDGAITCRALVKSFGKTRALDGLDLEVATGEIHGFLGPNGSGKTVTMRILLGVLRASSGSAVLLGGDPWHDAVDLHRHIAYVPGETNLWPNLTGGEIIDLLGQLRGGLDQPRRSELLDRFDLDPSKKARSYSKGNRQKVALIAALAAQAEVLLLDEPTAGLDPLMEAVFQDCLLEVRARGATVLLSSHILAEVEKICDRVTIIRNGRAVETGTLADLRVLSRTSFVVSLVGDGAPLEGISGVHNLQRRGRAWIFESEPTALEEVMRTLARIGVASVESHPPTLEEIFLRHYDDAHGGVGAAR